MRETRPGELPQMALIVRVRELCRSDPGLDAALMYGSFAQHLGDRHSDVEFWLFFEKSARPANARAWCEQVAPVNHLIRNEFGAVVAFFPGLIRGEFHLATVDEIAAVREWPARGADPDDMIVVDRRGALRAALNALPTAPTVPTSAEDVAELCGGFANWLVLAYQVAGRGETLRALDALSHTQRLLLWLARLAEDATEHWLTPSRAVERELSSDALDRVGGTYATPDEITRSLQRTWDAGRHWWALLAERHGFATPLSLWRELDAATGFRTPGSPEGVPGDTGGQSDGPSR